MSCVSVIIIQTLDVLCFSDVVFRHWTSCVSVMSYSDIGCLVFHVFRHWMSCVSVMTWCLYYLGANEDIQQRVFKELVNVLEDEPLTGDVINQLR